MPVAFFGGDTLPDARQHTRASRLSSSSVFRLLQRAMHFGHNLSRMYLSHNSQIDEIKLKGTGTG